ncbi:lasso peptide biosynthesis PqqD family chaperone [Oceanobacillus sp. CF4.6]|uniref:lasso peptide biosynthesis PqqD family chaperone n=1 Tax=Oceanobacillus sp. CF4.6 TaxID=3373080 RepID=UPI003EE53413
MKTVSLKDVVSQMEGNIVSDMDGEKVMLSIQNGKYYNLGDIGGEIWDGMKEPIAIQQLISTLVSQYDVDESVCEEQVIYFINLLYAEGLINLIDELAS